MVVALRWPGRRPASGEGLAVGFSLPEGARVVDDLLLGDGAGQAGAMAASPALDDILAPFLSRVPAKAADRAPADVIDLAAYRAQSPWSR